MAGAVLAAWISFDRRLTGVEEKVESVSARRAEDTRRYERIEDQLDRLIVREIGRPRRGEDG